ncbi:MAG TPA: hypothetical protein VMZ66_08605 [Aeromicrobium sp.]|nr:hypothetical protein [Aeromicrobium sp.]
MAKAAAKTGRATPAPAADASDLAADEDEKVTENVVELAVSALSEVDEAEAEAPESNEAEAPVVSQEPTDPRARAAQRVQRRLGKDAEKLTAAEARARAREEARRRRAQAKEQSSGVVAEEVVRPPEGPTERNLAEDVSVVEPLTEQTIEAEPFVDESAAEQTAVQEPVAEDQVAEEPVIDEPVVEDVIEAPEADLPKPAINQRIDEPAPADVDEPAPVEASEPVSAWKPGGTSRLRGSVETREIPKQQPTTLPMDGDQESKSRSALAPIAGVVGLIALGISVLLAVGALLVALGFDSGGLYEALRTVANALVGPLKDAFDFSGANAERKEHFLAWGAGSVGYLLISFVGQAVQRANDEA